MAGKGDVFTVEIFFFFFFLMIGLPSRPDGHVSDENGAYILFPRDAHVAL